jgi:DNA-binding transcriptional ArsR family regulator
MSESAEPGDRPGVRAEPMAGPDGPAAPADGPAARAEPAAGPADRAEPGDGRELEAEPVLIALADPIRRRILDTLAAAGAATATGLAAGLPVSRQAVMKHLAMLDRAGLVSVQRRGREMQYRRRPGPAAGTATWLAGRAAGWEQRLAAIRPGAAPAERAAPAADGQRAGQLRRRCP